VAQRFSAAISGPFSTAALAAECTSGEQFEFFSSLKAQPQVAREVFVQHWFQKDFAKLTRGGVSAAFARRGLTGWAAGANIAINPFRPQPFFLHVFLALQGGLLAEFQVQSPAPKLFSALSLLRNAFSRGMRRREFATERYRTPAARNGQHQRTALR
jgi:hypothetical protein